jgi:hypothetical protein
MEKKKIFYLFDIFVYSIPVLILPRSIVFVFVMLYIVPLSMDIEADNQMETIEHTNPYTYKIHTSINEYLDTNK